MAEASNADLIQNAGYLLGSHEQDNSKISWVGPTKEICDTTKFKLTY